MQELQATLMYLSRLGAEARPPCGELRPLPLALPLHRRYHLITMPADTSSPLNFPREPALLLASSGCS